MKSRLFALFALLSTAAFSVHAQASGLPSGEYSYDNGTMVEVRGKVVTIGIEGQPDARVGRLEYSATKSSTAQAEVYELRMTDGAACDLSFATVRGGVAVRVLASRGACLTGGMLMSGVSLNNVEASKMGRGTTGDDGFGFGGSAYGSHRNDHGSYGIPEEEDPE